LYKCYNGGCEATESGDVVSLVAHLKGMSYGQAKKLLGDDTYDSKAVRKKLNGVKKEDEPRKQSGKIDLNLKLECYGVDDEPDDRIGKRYVEALKKFIKERKCPIECFVAHSGRYKSRIILPIYISGEMVYFQARAITDDVLPKYLNPVVEKEHHILNIDKFNRDKYIVVTEGLLDALMIDYDQGTTPLGGHVDDDLLKILYLYTDKGLIMATDNWKCDPPALVELEKFVGLRKKRNREPSFYAQKVKYFVMPNIYKNVKDLNQLKMETDIENMYDFVAENSVSYLNLVTKLRLGN